MKNNFLKCALMALILPFAICIQSCHENLEERAARECKEFTERNCPQQLGNGLVYDSLTFENDTHTLHHHYSVRGIADNAIAFNSHKEELRKMELEGLRQDVSTKNYKEAGYNVAVTIRSGSQPKIIYFHTVFTAEELQ